MKKAKPKLEKEIQKDILEYLDLKKYFFWRANNIPVFAKNNGGKYMYRSLPKFTPKGIPDIIMVHSGKIICIEVKRENTELSIEQALFGTAVVNNGGIYFVARSVTDVIEELKKIDIV